MVNWCSLHKVRVESANAHAVHANYSFPDFMLPPNCCIKVAKEDDFVGGWDLLNPLTAEWALRALIDFTLSNARRSYSSMGKPLDGKELRALSNAE